MAQKTYMRYHPKWFSIIMFTSIYLETTSVWGQTVSMPVPGFSIARFALPSIEIGTATIVPTGTPVGLKTVEIKTTLQELEGEVSSLIQTTRNLYERMIVDVNRYHKTIGEIESKLQLGTTPANPQLLDLRNRAFQQLDKVTYTVNMMNDVSQGFTNFLQQATSLSSRVNIAFTIPGAVDEDHAHLILMTNELAQLEENIRRILNIIVTNVQRQKGWLDGERVRFETLSTAVDRGQLMMENGSTPLSYGPTFSKKPSPPHAHKKHIKTNALKPLAKTQSSTEKTAKSKTSLKSPPKAQSSTEKVAKSKAPLKSLPKAEQSSDKSSIDLAVSQGEKSLPSPSPAPSPKNSSQEEEKNAAPQVKEHSTYESVVKGRIPLGILEANQSVQDQKWYLFSSVKRASTGSIDIVHVLDDVSAIKEGKEVKALQGEEIKALLETQGFKPAQLHLFHVTGNADQVGKVYIFGQ